MALLNHTTEIDADRTAHEIAKMLSKAGARAVLTEYDPDSSQITAISFKMNVGDQDVGFRLPCDWRPVFEAMYKDQKPYSTHDKRYDRQQSERRGQAVRTAWRIVHTWIKAQLAIIETKMVSTEQVFLPYAVMKDGKTLFEKMVDSKFLLGDGS
jgi:hypothetical protein